jgi:hypothetical protein
MPFIPELFRDLRIAGASPAIRCLTGRPPVGAPAALKKARGRSPTRNTTEINQILNVASFSSGQCEAPAELN